MYTRPLRPQMDFNISDEQRVAECVGNAQRWLEYMLGKLTPANRVRALLKIQASIADTLDALNSETRT